jgi:hypothetical protein
MFRNYNKRKVIVLCLGLAAMTMLPQWVSAQDNGGSGTQAWSGKSLLGRDGSGNGYSVSTGQGDGGSHAGSFVSLFGRQNLGGDSGSGFNIGVGQFGGNGSQTDGNYGISIGTMGQDPPQPAPLGSGLFIMAAAGAAYAFSKKRKKQENN